MRRKKEKLRRCRAEEMLIPAIRQCVNVSSKQTSASKMRKLFYLIIIICLSCNSHPSDKEVETNALKIPQQLDSHSVTNFYRWNFFTRGGDNWVKKSGDSDLYTCNYSVVSDTTTITIYRSENFNVDFPCSFSFDTSLYWRFSLKKSQNDLVSIVGVNRNGQDITLATNQKLNDLFQSTNPYDTLSSLSSLKNSLKVIGITSHNDKEIGNFVQFILSRQHILTYFPYGLNLNNKYWKDEFSKGKMLNKNWNYRKLEGQLDNG